MARTNAITEWLDIPTDEQPPTHYRLLNLRQYTSDRAKINAAADNAIELVHKHADENNKAIAKKLAGMIEAARDCLLNLSSKSLYDEKLRTADNAKSESGGFDQNVISDRSNNKARAKKKTRGMLLPIIVGPIIPLAIYAFMFSGWFDGEKIEEEKPGGSQQVSNNTGSKPNSNVNRSQFVAEKSAGTIAVENKTVPAIKIARKTQPVKNGKKQPVVNPVKVKTETKLKPNSKTKLVASGTPKPKIDISNLLKQIDIKRDVIGGNWSLENGALVTDGGDDSRIVITDDAPNEFELHLSVTRTGTIKQVSWFALDMNIGDSRFSASLDFNQGWISGLSLVDGKSLLKNETKQSSGDSPLLKIGVESQVVYRVDSESVKVTVDGKTIISWKGDFARLSPHPNFKLTKKKQLGIGSFGPCRISKIALKPASQSKSKTKPTQKSKTQQAKRKYGRYAAISIPDVKPTSVKKDSPEWLAVKYLNGNAPGFMRGGFEFWEGGHPLDNTTYFKILSNGVVHMALSTRPGEGGNSEGGWKKRITTPVQLARAGWRPVGKIVDPKYPKFIFERYCRKGEFFTISWEKYIRPALILPGPRYLTPALPIPKNRLAVPDAVAQKKSLVLVKDIFKEEFATGKTASLKLALAQKLFAQGESTSDDMTVRFVLMQEARDLTVEAGDPLRAMEIINAIAQLYEIDQFIQKRDSLRILTRTVRSTPSNSQIIADTSFDAAKSALMFLQFDISQDLVRIASIASSKTRNREMTREISDFRKGILILKKMHGDAVSAAKTLTTKPEDPSANLARGEFLCFIMQDWAHGLPMLASGRDSGLKETATRDIAGATNTKQMTALGDVWWNLAQKKRGKSIQKTMMLIRAKFWYDKAIPDLTGLEKTKIEKRVQEIGELPPILQGIQKNAAPTS